MDPKTKSQPLPAGEASAGDPPEAFLQERLTGPVPAQDERSAAEILSERQAETGPDGHSPVFVP